MGFSLCSTDSLASQILARLSRCLYYSLELKLGLSIQASGEGSLSTNLASVSSRIAIIHGQTLPVRFSARMR
jgi:hypothetical protein